MKKDEVLYLKKILSLIKDPDGHINKAIAIVDKEIARYDAMKGQLKEQYEHENRYF